MIKASLKIGKSEHLSRSYPKAYTLLAVDKKEGLR